MNDYSTIEARFEFALPELYKKMVADQCFDHHQEKHLQFTDLEWLTAEQIFTWVFDKHLIEGLIPFAQTLSGNLWAWYPQLDPRNPQAVVCIPDEDEVAVIYAPDFCSAMYRMLLDEMANTFLVERGDQKSAQRHLREYCETLAVYFPAKWNDRLKEYSQRELQATQENFYGVIDEELVEEILAEDLVYDRLDEEFICVTEDEQ
ncbi:MAG: SMI1/KNR4 family protein [Planctomycetes bacterium]|nr:SMI1/KNR4 family protein [Planctomycetota bacterium]